MSRRPRTSSSPRVAEQRRLPPPNPPRPNKWLLLAATLALVAWLGFLLVMAFT